MIIKNKIILIQGLPGEGKSYLAVFIASCYSRIFSNLEITLGGKKINKTIGSIEDLKQISFSNIKGVAVLDEGGININARDSLSKSNRDYGELGMLSRKLNIDIIVCTQLNRMVDVYFREMATYRFQVHSWFDRKDYLMFEAKIYSGGSDFILKIARFDLFEFSRLTGIEYNTLDSSRISKNLKDNLIQQKKEIIKLDNIYKKQTGVSLINDPNNALWSNTQDLIKPELVLG